MQPEIAGGAEASGLFQSGKSDDEAQKEENIQSTDDAENPPDAPGGGIQSERLIVVAA